MLLLLFLFKNYVQEANKTIATTSKASITTRFLFKLRLGKRKESESVNEWGGLRKEKALNQLRNKEMIH